MSVCVRFSKKMDNRRNSDCKTDTLSLLCSFVKDENSFYNYNYNAKSVNTVILRMYMRACVGKKGDIVIAQHSICMGWLRLVGSLKLYVSFAEYRLFHRTLLQKSPMILRSLLIVAIP